MVETSPSSQIWGDCGCEHAFIEDRGYIVCQKCGACEAEKVLETTTPYVTEFAPTIGFDNKNVTVVHHSPARFNTLDFNDIILKYPEFHAQFSRRITSRYVYRVEVPYKASYLTVCMYDWACLLFHANISQQEQLVVRSWYFATHGKTITPQQDYDPPVGEYIAFSRNSAGEYAKCIFYLLPILPFHVNLVSVSQVRRVLNRIKCGYYGASSQAKYPLIVQKFGSMPAFAPYFVQLDRWANIRSVISEQTRIEDEELFQKLHAMYQTLLNLGWTDNSPYRMIGAFLCYAAYQNGYTQDERFRTIKSTRLLYHNCKDGQWMGAKGKFYPAIKAIAHGEYEKVDAFVRARREKTIC